MALPLTTLLQSINDKVVELAASRQKLIDRIAVLEEENDNLRKELENSQKEIEKSKTDIEFLTMSHRLADSPDSLVSTRRRISRLIRTIDNCISMLKEQ